jgi:integrase
VVWTSASGALAETAAVPRENDLLRWGWTVSSPRSPARPPCEPRTERSPRITSKFESSHPGRSDTNFDGREWIQQLQAAPWCNLKLLILTGQRREEIGALRWSEIDFVAQSIRLPAERTKNGKAHDVPLSEPAMRLLQAMPRRISQPDFVFGTSSTGFRGYSISKRALDRRIAAARQVSRDSEPMKPWTLHDLRRSCATGMGERLGIARKPAVFAFVEPFFARPACLCWACVLVH